MRKGILPVIPVLALVIALLAACGGDSGDPEPTPAATSSATNTASSPTTVASSTAATTTTPASATQAASAATSTSTTTGAAQPFAPFPARRADGEPQTDRCGTYEITREAVKSASRLPMADRILIRTATGSPVVELKNDQPFVRIGVDWCYDVNFDGNPELSVFTYTGGAHCCTTQNVYSFFGPKSELLFTYEAGNGGSLEPKDLDGKAPMELTGLDDRLAYFGDLSYAASPPIVIAYAYRNGAYVEATKEFPDLVRQHRSQLATEYAACATTQGLLADCQKGLGLGVMAESLVLGDWTAFSATLNPPAEVKAWLDSHQAELQTLVMGPKPVPKPS